MDERGVCGVPRQEEPASSYISDLFGDLCEEANPAKVPQNPHMEDSSATEQNTMGIEDLKLGRFQWLHVPRIQIFCPQRYFLEVNKELWFGLIGSDKPRIIRRRSVSPSGPKSLGLVTSDTKTTLIQRKFSGTSSKMISKPLRAENLILDVNTANNLVLISDGGKMASWTYESQYRPETPLRFQIYPQVLSCQSFSSGQHFWVVDVGLSYSWRVGMCYPSTDRGGRPGSAMGSNEQSWSLNMDGDQYFAGHGGKMTKLPNDQVSSNKVVVYLDYEAGQLSFHELRNPLQHLHTFSATFTEPLHAIVCVWEGSVRVSEGAEKSKGAIRQIWGM